MAKESYEGKSAELPVMKKLSPLPTELLLWSQPWEAGLQEAEGAILEPKGDKRGEGTQRTAV